MPVVMFARETKEEPLKILVLAEQTAEERRCVYCSGGSEEGQAGIVEVQNGTSYRKPKG
jgi:hypothetical protein